MDIGCPVMSGKHVIGFVSHIPTTDDGKIFISKTIDIKDIFATERSVDAAFQLLQHNRQEYGRPR